MVGSRQAGSGCRRRCLYADLTQKLLLSLWRAKLEPYFAQQTSRELVSFWCTAKIDRCVLAREHSGCKHLRAGAPKQVSQRNNGDRMLMNAVVGGDVIGGRK